jgi:predicted lipid-binding transport protein (Tim44 family)
MDASLIIFIALAAFVAFRLYSVLGTRTGEERHREIEGLQRARARADKEPEKPESAAAIPTPPPVSAAAEPLRAADPSFNEQSFLSGARAAYEMIVEAFAAGDLKSIRRYLSPSVFEAFRSAVAARDSAGQRFDVKFVGIEDAKIVESRVEGGNLIAATEFRSNQVRATYDAGGAVVSGDPTRIDLVRDRWTFSRPIDSTDPNWTLIATGG